MTRRRRRHAAWLTLLAVFLAQLATAAYACAWTEAPMTRAAPVSAEPASPCADMAMADAQAPSALCVEHCKVGGQLVDNHSSGQPPAPTPLLLGCAAVLDAQLFIADGIVTEPLLARATAPPVFASSSRLRI